jgi:hypothetical protein
MWLNFKNVLHLSEVVEPWDRILNDWIALRGTVFYLNWLAMTPNSRSTGMTLDKSLYFSKFHLPYNVNGI